MKLNVLVGMLSTLLSSDEMLTAEYLAEKFEVSLRTVYRYVSMLSEGGVPIESRPGRGGGWRVVDAYKLKAMYFSAEEYDRLIFAVQSFSLQDDVTKSAADKLAGLSRSLKGSFVLKSDQLIVDSCNDSVREALNTLSAAISDKLIVHMEYHSKEGDVTKRFVEPYCLIFKDDYWYVYCFCRLRRDFRYFRVSRIVRLTVGEDKFLPRPYQADSGAIETEAVKDKEIGEVILTVEKCALTAAEEWLGMGCVARVGDNFIAKAVLPLDDVTVNRIMSLGDGVRVEKPSKLREAVAERCRRILKCNVPEKA